MALPDIGSLSVEHKITVPFAAPSSEGDSSRSMADGEPDTPVLSLWIKACAAKKWDELREAATVKDGRDDVIEYERQAEPIFLACVKGAAGTDGERVEFTPDDAAALADEWPKHVRVTALNNIISLNSVGTLAPLVRPKRT